MFKKINFLKSISLIALFIAFFGLAISAYACNTGNGGFGGGFWGWGGKQHDNKVTICHIIRGKTVKYSEMTVDKKDLFSYLKHGDYLGKCFVPKPKPEKITICHIPNGDVSKEHTIIIDKSALKAHLAHGDYVGECKPPVPPVCGDGKVNPGEQCDDGNLLNNDGCSATCKLEVCGDGVQQTNEQCDDGNTVSGDGCDSTCHIEIIPACGDGNVDPGEQCDDGNLLNNDGCSSTCKLEVCGDGVQQTNEQCDDGNTANNDGCSSVCKLEVCGDGVQQTNEQCDDGNTVNGDGCSSACIIEAPVNEIFAQGVLTAITKDGQQKGEADLNLATNTFAKIILACTAWNECSLQLVRSSGTNPYDFSATFDTGTLSAETCDGNGVCTENSTFTMPVNPDPSNPQALSMTFAFTDTAGTSEGEAVISLAPNADKINVTGNVGVVNEAGANMVTIGEAEASNESNVKVVNFSSAEDGATASMSQSSIVAYDHSAADSTNKSIASGAGSVSATNDTVGANMSATTNHNIVSNGTGDNAVSSCEVTSDSNGDSLATLDALAQDGLQTADSVNHNETLNAPGATVTVHAHCGDVQF